MKISEVIDILQKYKEEHGDINVAGYLIRTNLRSTFDYSILEKKEEEEAENENQ